MLPAHTYISPAAATARRCYKSLGLDPALVAGAITPALHSTASRHKPARKARRDGSLPPWLARCCFPENRDKKSDVMLLC